MLALDDAISLGRFQSAYSTFDIQNHELKVTYTVFNQQGEDANNVEVATQLLPGIAFKSSSITPDVAGSQLTWDIGTIAPFGSASIELIVTLPTLVPLQVDSGASVSALIGGVTEVDTSPAVRLRNAPIVSSLLASTPDANTSDHYVRSLAAQLDHDPQQIFSYLKNEIGFESYVGSLRGARGALWSGAANSLDEASLGIALLRASGIPARYVEGTLSEATAKDLILSMFPDPYRVVGIIDPGVTISDPANDGQLLAETQQHYWYQFDAGSGMVDADPAFRDSQLGTTIATPTGAFSEVPQSLRHTTAITLQRELLNSASNLFGLGTSLDRKTVLEQEFNTVELVGKPITIGHLVSSSSMGFVFSSTTNTYSPYLAIGETGGNPITEEIIRGEDYQEFLTSFPLGSLLLTGVFLEMELRSASGAVETFERTIADRIGLATRRNGGGGGVSIDPASPALLGPLDLMTISVMGSRHYQKALEQADQRLDALQADYTNFVAEFAAAAEGPERDALLPEAISLSKNVYIASARARLALFESISDQSTDGLAETALIKAYWDSPRVTIYSTQPTVLAGDVASIKFSLDLRDDDIRAIAYPIQAIDAEVGFRITRGFAENGLETGLMELPTELSSEEFVIAPSTANILQAAVDQGIAIVILSDGNRTLLSEISLSADAKVLISDAIDRGRQVIVPVAAVQIDGKPRIGWYEQDLNTGYTIGVLEDGSHGAIVEYFGLEGDIAYRTNQDQFFIGVLVGASASSIAKVAVLLFGVGVNAAIKDNEVQQAATNAKQAVKLFIDAIKSETFDYLQGKPPIFVAGFVVGWTLNVAFAADPPVGTSFFGSAPTPALQNLSGINVAAEIIHDPLFSVPFQGALLPTVYRAGIRNLTATAQTYNLDVGNVPPGFSARIGLNQVTVPAGETAEVSIALYPTGNLPASGAQSSFELIVTSATNPAISLAESEPFVVPEVRAVIISTDPQEVTTTPGVGVETVFVLQSVGNVPATVDLQSVLPPNLQLTGLSDVVIHPGQILVQFITLTPAANTPLNSTLAASIRSNFGGIENQEIDIRVHVAAPGVEAISRAATTARNIGNVNLGNRLDDLSAALSNLIQELQNPIFKSQTLASLDAIIRIINADSVLFNFAELFVSARESIAAAQTNPALLAAINSLATTLEDFADTVFYFSQGNFEVFLTPSTQVAQPGSPVTFEVVLHNIGFSTTTYDLSLSALPPGVTGQLSASSVTLDRDQFSTTLLITITPPTNELAPFTFEVVVALRDAPELTKSALGSLTVRNEFLSVVDVTALPLYVNPGDTAQVYTRLFNAVNRPQDLLVSYVVTNAAGTQVFVSTPTTAEFDTQTALLNVSMDDFSTSGLPVGQYFIDITVTDSLGTPLAGGKGSGTVFVGAPLTGTITVGPTDLGQGTSTITTTLTVESQAPLASALSVVSQTIVSSASDVNRYGDYVYVATSSGVRVYNVAGANINAPVFVRTVGSTANFMEIKGDKLYVISGFNTKLSIYSLATPDNPNLIGETATLPYNAADSMVVTDTHVYVSAIQFTYFLSNADIFDHNGALLSINISNPAAPMLDGVLFNENGTNNDGIKSIGGIDQFGGNRNVWSVKQVTPTLLYLAGSTATGTNTQAGVGIISIIDISNPLSLTVLREVTIPGTVHALGLSIEGDTAFVTGTTGGWNDFSFDFGFTGNVVLATLDISSPSNPLITHSETLARAARGISADNTSLGNGIFAFSSLGPANGQPALFVTDFANPSAPLVASVDVPTEIRRHFSSGNFIYTVSPSGLVIYQVDPIEAIPATASVQIPKGNQITPILSSFSTPPSQIISGADFDTYIWDVTFVSGVSTKTISWDSTVTNLKPGEVRSATLETTIEYELAGNADEIALPAQEVVGRQILSLNPGTYTIQPGDAAFFGLTIYNPTSVGRNFEISVQGIPPEWVEIASPIFVSQNSAVFTNLVIRTSPFAPEATYSFTVTATSGGIIGSVGGEVTLVGEPLLHDSDPHSAGIVAQLIPGASTTGRGGNSNYVVRLTNTGSRLEYFSLSTLDLPQGYVATFSESVVPVAPGVENYRDVLLTVNTPLTGTTGTVSFKVIATGSRPEVRAELQGVVNLVNVGVATQFQTTSGPPGQTYQLLVRNTGSVSETFDLKLSGPGAIVAALNVSSVTLAPGASQLVNVSLGTVDFSYPGNLPLIATAIARSNLAVQASDQFEIEVAGYKAMTATFETSNLPSTPPGPFSAVLNIENLGNLEDEYVAEIQFLVGPVSATFTDFTGASVQTIPVIRLPGLTTGAIRLNGLLNAAGAATVIVQVRSLTDDSIVANATLQIGNTSSNRPPVITSNGGGEAANVSLSENTLFVTDVNSSDPDLPVQVRTYSLEGGIDADKFAIDAQTGILSFKVAPNFESPSDQGQNNVYEVIVRVTDGFLFDSQTISITIGNVNEAPVITSGGGGATASVAIAENSTFVYDANSSDPDLPSQPRTYSISGGVDAGFFSIDAGSGILSFKAAPNFENPLDQGKNNIYDVIIRVSDGALVDTQAIGVTVQNVNEAPMINSYGSLDSVSLSVPEGTLIAADANSSDPDLPAQERTYSIAGGADASRFTVDRISGVLSFLAAPDFENPVDAGRDNVYNVVVRVTDGELTDTQAYSIAITNVVNESLSFVVIGADAGAVSDPLVKVYRSDGSLLEAFLAYEVGYRGGVRVATGDVTGDGVVDIVTAPGRGHAPIIKVFDGTSITDGLLGNARELPAFVIQAYDLSFSDGLFIAIGDVVGDSLLDVVAIPERGNTEVRVFRNRLNDTPHPHPGDAFSNTPWRSFFPFDSNFVGGGTIAVGEIDRAYAKNEVIVGSGSGMNATVKAFNVNSSQAKLLKTYTAIDATFRGGVFVAAGDINGDGIADIVAGAGQGGSSKVSVIDGRNGNSLGAIYPYSDVSKQSSVRVALRDSNGDGIVDSIFAGHGADGKTKTIRRYDITSKKMADFLFETDSKLGGGYFLG